MNTSKVKITETVPLFDVADVDRSIDFYVMVSGTNCKTSGWRTTNCGGAGFSTAMAH